MNFNQKEIPTPESKEKRMKQCYQCEKSVDYLFHDSRCSECTSLHLNEHGEGVYDDS